MSRLIKEKITGELQQRYQGVSNCILINYQPLGALQTTELRSRLAEDGLEMDVLKNTLARRIFQQLNLTSIQPYLDGPTALVFAPPAKKSDDSVLLAKKVVTLRDKYKVLQIKGGLLDGSVVTLPQIKQIAALPSREILLSQLAATLNGPLTKLACGLKGMINKAGYLFKALADKQETSTKEPKN
jgi:large subunit ribosomal protein L10